MGDWSFLTNHARALLCIAHVPGVRLRDIATTLGITERTAYGIIVDLTEAGYVVKDRHGRRNRYRVQAHLPLRGAIGREQAVGEVLDLLVDTNTGSAGPKQRPEMRQPGPLLIMSPWQSGQNKTHRQRGSSARASNQE